MVSSQPLILALDVATVCGFARGHVGERPIAGSIRFGAADASANAIFGNCLRWFSKLTEEHKPDLLILESLLPGGAMRGKTTSDVRDRLAGLHGVIRGVAHLRGIFKIAEASVGDVRAHFINDRRLKRARAKRETMLQCQMMGWEAKNDHEADALALWSYACALIDPKTALNVVPMFHRRAS